MGVLDDEPWLTEYEAFSQSWAPFTECLEVPLNREPNIEAWAPFLDVDDDDDIPLDREPCGAEGKLESNIMAAGTSTGPYGLCFIHHDVRGSADSDSDSDMDFDYRSTNLDNWVDKSFELSKPENVVDDSQARLEWLALKEQGERNAPMDAMMSIVGPQLEPIKEHFLLVRKRFVSARNVIPPKFFNLALRGSSKASKRMIASLFAWFLKSLDVAERSQDELELAWSQHGDMLSPQLNHIIPKRSSDTIFIMLLAEEKDLDLDALCQSDLHRFTFEKTFAVPQYNRRTHEDLRRLVVKAIDAKGILINPGDEAPVYDNLARQAAKRQKTKIPQFDDAVNVAGVLEKACKKMKHRLIMKPGSEGFHKHHGEREWRWKQAVRQLGGEGSQRGQTFEMSSDSAPPPPTADIPDDSRSLACLTLEDVAGPPIPVLKADNKSWKKLQSMTGLDNIKEEFAHMIDYAQRKKERERLGLDAPRTFSLHRTFLGPPGVGKTTIAKLYGQLIIDLGLVSGIKEDGSHDSDSEYDSDDDSRIRHHKAPRVVDPSKLMGAYIGWSERYTKRYLSKAQGGVLIIDEAHMLYTSSESGGNNSDVFRRAVIDTIVSKVTADPDEDRCVILVGYPDHMEDMFLHSNPGLQRRFPKETAMHFDSYPIDQLLQIFSAMMEAERMNATEDALQVARQVLTRMRINPQFGNGGDVGNLLATARRRNLARKIRSTWTGSSDEPLQLEPEDIDPRWNRLLDADENRTTLFEKYVGFEEITDKFEQYKNIVVGMKKRGVDPRPEMPWNFVFEGPPGTGKTSTARMLGRLYYDLGLLSTDEVVECSVSDLLDMSGLKVVNVLEKSLGKVLFIDEAYRLEGTRAGSMITGELVDAVTKERYARNLVIVLAGYTKEMDSLLSTNQGLRSRFPERIRFPTLRSKGCKSLLEQELRRNGIVVEESPRGAGCRALAKGFHRLRGTKAWASARDVETLARSIAKLVFAEEGRGTGGDSSEMLMVSTAKVLRQMRIMYEERASQEGETVVLGLTRQEDSDAE